MESTSLALARSWLGKRVTIRVDRPLGSRHPRWGYVYPINYGCLPGVLAPDGEELDAYVLGVEQSLNEFTGRCIAILHRRDDDDDKLVVAPDGRAVPDDEIRARTWFQEQYFDSEIVRE
jgi:inorganic pyrophosphatase